MRPIEEAGRIDVRILGQSSKNDKMVFDVVLKNVVRTSTPVVGNEKDLDFSALDKTVYPWRRSLLFGMTFALDIGSQHVA